MDQRLELLETFMARGPDGREYKVLAFERLARSPALSGDHWESTGVLEYRLEDGQVLDTHKDGTASVAAIGLTLTLPQRARA